MIDLAGVMNQYHFMKYRNSILQVPRSNHTDDDPRRYDARLICLFPGLESCSPRMDEPERRVTGTSPA
jgi:hypothetical protein